MGVGDMAGSGRISARHVKDGIHPVSESEWHQSPGFNFRFTDSSIH